MKRYTNYENINECGKICQDNNIIECIEYCDSDNNYMKYLHDLDYEEYKLEITRNIHDIRVRQYIYNQIVDNMNEIPNSVIESFDYETLEYIVSYNEYKCVSYNLEEEIGNYVSIWMLYNESEMTDRQYKYLWDNLRHELIGINNLSVFVKMKQYERYKNDIGGEIAYYIANSILNINQPMQKQRWEK